MAGRYKTTRILVGGLFFICLGLWSLSLIAENVKVVQPSKNLAILLDLKGGVGPATQDYVHRGLEQATKENAKAIIIRIDTPGGLDTAMRGIIRDIIASPIPVISYVAPSGARAASAGTFIVYASHVAAMAPGTNLGAATPVGIGVFGGGNEQGQKGNKPSPTTEEIKAKNDAVAYIHSLAQLRGRNIQWAEKAVSEGASLSAEEALKSGVIDLIAIDVPSLLNQSNGRTVLVQGQKTTLNTAGLAIQTISQDWRTQLLDVITDPSVAYILLLVGIYGLFFEFVNPGFVLPGVVGVISLLLALYAFQLLPINYAGLALIVFGIAFMIGEAFFPSGALGVGGVVAFVFGSVLLLNSEAPGFRIALSLILSVSIVSALFFLLVANLALKARFRPVVSGQEQLPGSVGEVVKIEAENILARVRGELWQVQSESPLQVGQKIIVIGRQGLVLKVKPELKH